MVNETIGEQTVPIVELLLRKGGNHGKSDFNRSH